MAENALKTSDVSFDRAYLIDPASKWYRYISAKDTVYIKKIPPTTIYNPAEFEKLVVEPWKEQTKTLKKAVPNEDNRRLWNQYAAGEGINSTDWYYNYIPNYEEVPYYDWHYGCSPTSAAMCLGYYDQMSIKSGFEKYGLFVSYYYTEKDEREDETDYQIPDIQKILADKMKTKGDGTTYIWNIPEGIEKAATIKGHGCDADGDGSGYDLNYGRTSVVNQIKKDRPCLMNTYDHTVAVVGYKRRETDWGTAKYKFFVHDTWDGQLHCWNFKDLYSMVKIDVKNPRNGDLKIISPYSDYRYNSRGLGQDLRTNIGNTIVWETTNPDYGSVDIIYRSPYDTILIADHTENDGVFVWHTPEIQETNAARIDLIWYDALDNIIAEDGCQSDISVIYYDLPALFYGRNLFANTFPASYKVSIPEKYPWSVLAFGIGPANGYNILELFSSTSFEHLKIKHEIPSTDSPTYKNNFVVFHSRSIGFPTQQWLGVKTWFPAVDEPENHTLDLRYSGHSCGLGDNHITWEHKQIVDIYNLVINLPNLSYQDTLKFTLDLPDYTSLDLGFALFTPLTTYKYDSVETAKALNYYADENGAGQDEILIMDPNNYSTLFTKLSQDTCALVIFAKEPVYGSVDLNFNISTEEFPSRYKSISSDSSFLIAKNPTRVTFDTTLLSDDNTLGALAIKPEMYSRWGINSINMYPKLIDNFFFFVFDTLAASEYPYPQTNFCIFDFTNIGLLPFCSTSRLNGGGYARAQFDLCEPILKNRTVSENWATEDLIKVWELNTEKELSNKNLYSYNISLDERGAPSLANFSMTVIPLPSQTDTSDTTISVFSRQELNGYSPSYDRLTGMQSIKFEDRPGRFAIIVWTDNVVSTSYELNIDMEEITGFQEKHNTAKEFYLKQNYPNPFNQSTIFEYGLARNSNVVISIYDNNGNLVETIAKEYKNAGNHKIKWTAKDIPTGLYFYRIEAGNYSDVKKCILMK